MINKLATSLLLLISAYFYINQSISSNFISFNQLSFYFPSLNLTFYTPIYKKSFPYFPQKIIFISRTINIIVTMNTIGLLKYRKFILGSLSGFLPGISLSKNFAKL